MHKNNMKQLNKGINHLIDQRLGHEAALQRPQVFPPLSLMNPFSPHEVPHEFLTCQTFELSYPTNKTP